MKITQTIAFEVPADAIAAVAEDSDAIAVTLSWESAMELAEGLDRALNRSPVGAWQQQKSTTDWMGAWEGESPADQMAAGAARAMGELADDLVVEETPESLSAAQILARMEVQAAAVDRAEPHPGTHDGRNPGTGIGSGVMRPQR